MNPIRWKPLQMIPVRKCGVFFFTLVGAALLLVVGCGRDAASSPSPQSNTPTAAAIPHTVPATASETRATTRSNTRHDWPAFHGGGALLGVADLLPPPLKVRWTYAVDEKKDTEMNGSAAIVGDTVYVADASGKLHALNTADGTPRWTYSANAAFWATPLVVNNRVFIGDVSETMHCVDCKTGKKIWTYPVPLGIKSSANAADDAIIFGTIDNRVICLDQARGRERWIQETKDSVMTTPAIRGGLAYVGGCDNGLRIFDAASGSPRHYIDLHDPTGASPAVLENDILMGTHSGRFYCFSADGSTERWSKKEINDSAMFYASAAVANSTVVVPCPDRRVRAYRLNTGEQMWVFQASNQVDTSPVICGDTVYVASADKNLYALALETGDVKFTYIGTGKFEASPAVGQGVLVIADMTGKVYCFEPADK